MKNIYTIVDAVLRAAENLAALVAAGLLLVVMSVVSADAILRYALNAPLFWQYVVTSSYLLVALICLPLAWGFRTGGYVRVSGLHALMPPAATRFALRLGLLVSCAYVAMLAWKSGQYFLDTFLKGEMQMTGIALPNWLSWVWVPLGLGLLALRLFITAIGPGDDLAVVHEPDAEV